MHITQIDIKTTMTLASSSPRLVNVPTGSVIEKRSTDGYVNATQMCKAAGKMWANFMQNDITKSYMEDLADATSIPLAELTHIQHGGSKPGTWVHPQVADRLAAWCRNRKRKRDGSGYVYAVTSKCLDAVKIGLWTGSLDRLKARYITPYGPTLVIWHAMVEDCVAAEAALHQKFRSHNMGGELFDKSQLEHYLKAIEDLKK